MSIAFLIWNILIAKRVEVMKTYKCIKYANKHLDKCLDK